MKYLVKDNFLPQSYIEFLRLEMYKLKDSLSYDGYENNKRLRDKLDPRYAGTVVVNDRRSLLHNIWTNNFWKEMGHELRESEDSALVHASYTRFGSVLFSSYGDNDYYGHHVDIDLDCIATAVLMLTLKDPIQFEGGAFMLEDIKIEFKNNRLIVFPSCKMHGVEKVKLQNDVYENRRFTVQYFISSVTRKGTFADEGNYK